MTPTETVTSGPQFTSRPRDDERPTRKPLALWDRVKFLLLLTALYWFFVWGSMADNPLLPFADAVHDEAEAKWWLFLLGGIELLRQTHYLVSEHWAAYHQFWTQKVFGGFNQPLGPDERLDPLPAGEGGEARRLPGRVGDRPRHDLRHVARPRHLRAAAADRRRAAVRLPARVRGVLRHLPVRRDLLVPVPGRRRRLLPGRHQDAVHRRVGTGQRPGPGQGEHGLPRGTRGRSRTRAATSRAASCCGGRPARARRSWPRRWPARPASPTCSSTPARSSTCSWASAILKVKSLFRKLRQLALRYGGVIVFFDEADSLGNRGQLQPGPMGGPMATPGPFDPDAVVPRLVVPVRTSR